jgi:hypothetical protein
VSWEKLKDKPNGHHISIDGFPRTKQQEIELNADFASLFSTDLGKKVLDYLRSITLDAVGGRSITNDELRYLEGMRYLYLIMKRRVDAHKEN